MHKKLLMGFGTLALGFALAAPAIYAVTPQPMQIAQADTGAEQKAPKTKKKHHKSTSKKKKHTGEASKQGMEKQPQ